MSDVHGSKKDAPESAFRPAGKYQKSIGDTLREKASVKLIWDDNYLYVGAEFQDSDVVQEGKEDQSHFYSSGDLLEM